MIILFTLLALVLLSLCLTWTKPKLLVNLALISVLSLSALGLYFVLGYHQAYQLKDLIAQIEVEPASVDYDEVHLLLDQHLIWHPEDALAQTFEGRLYFASGDYVKANASFAKAHALLPDDPDLLVEYATTLYITGESPEILAKLIRQLIDHENMPYSAHSLLANIAMDQGEFTLAKTHWEALLRFIPHDTDEAQHIRTLLREL